MGIVPSRQGRLLECHDNAKAWIADEQVLSGRKRWEE